MRNMPRAVRYSMMRGSKPRSEERQREYIRNDVDIGVDSRYPVYNNSEARFRDRTGREHYDNGRFAPMRSKMDYGINDSYVPGYETRNGMDNYPRSEYSRYQEDDSPRRIIGFTAPSMHYTGPRRMNEMEHHSGTKERGYGASEAVMPLDKETAQRWTKMMHNEDGTHGEHWSMEQTTSILQQRGYKHNPVEWYAVMNAMFSDYYVVAKKYGMAGNADFYADLANAWLNDKDAVDDKAAVYFAKVVKH